MAEQPIPQTAYAAYVYEIIVDGVVRYIGKGRGRRAKSHIQIAKRLISHGSKKFNRSRFYRKLAAAIRAGAAIDYRIAASGLTDADAFELERDEILRAPFGQLWNACPGGEGQDSAYLKERFSDPAMKEMFRQKTLAAWARNPDRKDVRFAEPGAREAQRKMVREKWADPEYREMQREARRNGRQPDRRGKPSPALSAPAKARWSDPEFKARAVAAMKAAATPERREAISRRLKEQWANPEHRAKRLEKLIQRRA